MSLGDAPTTAVRPVDFRQQNRISRDAIIALESMHDAFARRLATAWSASSFTVLEVEHVATDHLTIDDFVRSLPAPTALATLRIDRIGAPAFVQVDLPFALLFVERLLGGPGDPATAPVSRRPTDLEAVLLGQELYGPVVQAVDEALRDVDGEPSSFVEFEVMPQPLQLGSPDELLVLLTYRVEVRGGTPAQGLVTLAYPSNPILTHLDGLLAGADRDTGEHADANGHIVAETLLEAGVDVQVLLGGSTAPVGSVSGLATGDVLRLDHPADRPARLVVDDRDVGTAHLGRRRRYLAVQVASPPAALPPSRIDAAEAPGPSRSGSEVGTDDRTYAGADAPGRA